jgi:PilZ domain-containing protein
MERFEYRTARFAIDVPVQMTLRNAVISGQCVDISEDGMRVECPRLDGHLCRGSVTVMHPKWSLEVDVQVAYSTPTHTGLKFLYHSERERNMVARFVASLGYAVCVVPPSNPPKLKPRRR